MATSVKIELMMDASGAVTGFRSLDGAATKVQTTIKAVAASGTEMGNAVAAGAAKGSAAVKEVGGHALTSLDSVRLFRDEFGIHIPRSMEKMMAQSKLVMAGINAIGPAMAAVGGVGIFAALGEEFYKVGQEIFKADDEVQKFNKHLSESAHEKFMDTSSIEDVRDSIIGARAALISLDKEREIMGTTAFRRFGNSLAMGGVSPQGIGAAMISAHLGGNDLKDVDADRNQNQSDQDKLTLRAEEQRHKLVDTNLDVELKKASSIQGVLARNAREADLGRQKDSEAQYHLRQNAVMTTAIANRTSDTSHQLNVDPNAGQTERASADSLVNADLAAKDAAFEKQRNDELRKLAKEANNEDLQGFQLMEAQKAQAYDDFVRRYGASTTALTSINKRFTEEETRASDELTRKLTQNAMEAQLGGMTGIGAIQQRGRIRDSATEGDLSAGKFAAAGDSTAQRSAADQEIAANHLRTNQEIAEAEKRFNEDVSSMAAASADKQVQGFARITAEGKKQLDDLQKKFEAVYGTMADKTSPEYMHGLADLNKGKAAINTGTDSQASQLTQKNAEETAKMERDSYAKAAPAGQQREQEIRAQYADRVAAYKQMLDTQQIADDDYNRRKAAAEREMNAELATEARAQRDRLAGQIEPFFKNPMEAMKNAGDKAASQFAATALMHFGGKDVGEGGRKKSGGLFDIPTMFGQHGAKGGVGPGAMPSTAAMNSMTVTATNVTVNGHSLNLGGGGSTSGSNGAGGRNGVGGMAAVGGTSAVASSSQSSSFSSGAPAGADTSSDPSSLTSSQSTGITGAGPSGIPGIDASGNGDVTGKPPALAAMGKTGMESAEGTAQNAYGMAQSAESLGKDLYGAAGPKSPSATATAPKGGKLEGQIETGVSGGMGMFSAVEGNGGAGGALHGAAAGAQIGSLAGPWGMLIGAAAGAIIGAIGFGGAGKAKKYEETQVRPRISQDILAFGMGSMDYQSAYDDLTKLDLDAAKQTKQWGPGGKGEYNNRIKPEILAAQATLTREQKSGRAKYGMSAAQFDSGGQIRGFGDMGTTSTNGWIHAKIGETVMHQGATDTHGDALGMILAGANRKQMAGYYGGGAQEAAPAYRSTMQNGAFGGGNTTNNYGHTIHALDAKSVTDLLMANRHSIRAANNASYAENSGGSDIG